MRWLNYGSEDDTWEPPENLSDCKEKLDEFMAEQKRKQKLRVQVVLAGLLFAFNLKLKLHC